MSSPPKDTKELKCKADETKVASVLVKKVGSVYAFIIVPFVLVLATIAYYEYFHKSASKTAHVRMGLSCMGLSGLCLAFCMCVASYNSKQCVKTSTLVEK
jgi:hypothetical protein